MVPVGQDVAVNTATMSAVGNDNNQLVVAAQAK